MLSQETQASPSPQAIRRLEGHSRDGVAPWPNHIVTAGRTAPRRRNPLPWCDTRDRGNGQAGIRGCRPRLDAASLAGWVELGHGPLAQLAALACLPLVV